MTNYIAGPSELILRDLPYGDYVATFVGTTETYDGVQDAEVTSSCSFTVGALEAFEEITTTASATPSESGIKQIPIQLANPNHIPTIDPSDAEGDDDLFSITQVAGEYVLNLDLDGARDRGLSQVKVILK